MRKSQQQQHPMVNIVQYQLEASMHLADAVFSGTEKIDRAMLVVTHQAVDRQLKFARAVTDMRDPSRVAELQVAIAGRPEKAMQCQHEIMSALVEIQAEFGKSMRDCMEKCSELANERVVGAGEQVIGQVAGKLSEQAARHAGEAAGAGARAQAMLPESGMMNPFFGMISMWEQAFREASRLASQNMMVASSSAEQAASFARDAVHAAGEAAAGNGHASQSPQSPQSHPSQASSQSHQPQGTKASHTSHSSHAHEEHGPGTRRHTRKK